MRRTQTKTAKQYDDDDDDYAAADIINCRDAFCFCTRLINLLCTYDYKFIIAVRSTLSAQFFARALDTQALQYYTYHHHHHSIIEYYHHHNIICYVYIHYGRVYYTRVEVPIPTVFFFLFFFINVYSIFKSETYCRKKKINKRRKCFLNIHLSSKLHRRWQRRFMLSPLSRTRVGECVCKCTHVQKSLSKLARTECRSWASLFTLKYDT